MTSFMKNVLKNLLQTEVIGRLSRKTVTISIKILFKLIHFMQKVQYHLPYIKKLNQELDALKIARVDNYYEKVAATVRQMDYQPKISILIPVYKVDTVYLTECIQSVVVQTYQNWEICLVDDCSEDPKIVKLVREFQKKFPDKIKFSTNEVNSHISITSNNCLALASGDYIALLDNDDRIYPNALSEMVRAINLNDRPEILYSDERHIDKDGNLRFGAYRKPAWSPFMHLCMNYTTHLSVYKKSLIEQIGGFRKGFEGSQDHDLMLRAVEHCPKPVVHIPVCLYQWRAHPTSTAASVNAKPYAAIAGEKAVREALLRRGRPCEVTYDPDTVHYRLKFNILKNDPSISIIVDARHETPLTTSNLIALWEKSTRKPLEIIVVATKSNLAESKEVSALGNIPIRYEECEDKHFGQSLNPFSFGAKGEFLLFVSGAVSPSDPEWIEELLGLGQFPEVGAVGPRIRDQKNRIHNAGFVLNPKWTAIEIGLNCPENHPLNYQVLRTIHECAAFNSDCFFIEKAKFVAAGGFEQNYLSTPLSFIELSLKLSRLGYSNIFTPFSRLVYFGGKRLPVLDATDLFYFRRHYSVELINDPNLNPNIYYTEHFNIDPLFEELDLNAREFHHYLFEKHQRDLAQ